MRALSRAKQEALKRPEEFARDMMSGRVVLKEDGLFSPAGIRAAGQHDEDEDEEDSSESDEDEDEEVVKVNGHGQNGEGSSRNGGGLEPSPMKARKKGKGTARPPKAAWLNLPQPQSVARSPTINWSQYGVRGEALDKLHDEQISAPTRGTPATVKADGTYDFKGGHNPDDGKKLAGVAAPYSAFRDKLDKKSRSSKRG